MTRRLNAFDALLHEQDLGMQMEVVDGGGRRVLRVDPIVFRLVREGLEAGMGMGKGRLATPSSSPVEKKKEKRKKGPERERSRSRGEEKARIGKGK